MDGMSAQYYCFSLALPIVLWFEKNWNSLYGAWKCSQLQILFVFLLPHTENSCYHTLRIAGNVVYCLPMHYCTSRSRLLVFKPIRFFCVARSLFLMFANRRLAVLWGLCPYLASIWHPLHLYGGLECVGTLVAYLATPGPSYLHFH